MPELPEVQTVVDGLKSLGVPGRRVIRTGIYWPKTIAGMRPATFSRRIKGCVFQRITRRGKYIVMHLSRGQTLLVHLRMTGRLNWKRPAIPRDRHEHVILRLNGARELRFHDTRKFGRMILSETPETILSQLGPEPLATDFTGRCLHRMLQGRRRAVKPLLLDQRFLAGLGNIYADEALWHAGIHPLRISCTLSKSQAIGLQRSISLVLNTALQNMGTTIGSGEGNFYSVAGRRGRNADELKVFRRTDLACPRCGVRIERLIVAQRSSHICPKCQPAPA